MGGESGLRAFCAEAIVYCAFAVTVYLSTGALASEYQVGVVEGPDLSRTRRLVDDEDRALCCLLWC